MNFQRRTGEQEDSGLLVPESNLTKMVGFAFGNKVVYTISVSY